MNIALFGGAFDPPHLGHLRVVNDVLGQGIVDQVWLVPVGTHDFNKQMAPASTRVKLLQLILRELNSKNRSRVKIERCELNRAGVNHTIDTLNQLSASFDQDRFSFIIGSDNLEKFHLWHGYQQILSHYLVYVYPRQNYPMQPLYTGMIPLSGVRQMQVSSSVVKQRLCQNKNYDFLADLLPQSILDYLKLERLYLD